MEFGASFASRDNESASGWQAQLNLRFAARASPYSIANERTVLVGRMHSGPLVVQKPLYPEGERICHAVIVHPPGGIAGGDQLQLRADLENDAHALLTTPGAGKWYKANGLSASQQLQFALAENAVLEWLPQETILFDAAQAQMTTRVDLSGNAKYAGWEIICFGRRAAGEKFTNGSLRQRTQIHRDGELIWNDAADLCAGSRAMLSPVGMHGCSVNAVFIVAAGAVPAKILDACRAIVPRNGNRTGITALPEIFATRLLGDSAEQARDYFEAVWKILRPWYAQTEMQRPRIWNT